MGFTELFDTQFSQVISRSSAAGIGMVGDEMATVDEGPAPLDIQVLGIGYDVRRLTEADVSDVFALAKGNRRFYRALGVRPSRARLTEIISDVPEGAGPNDKYIVGFYDEGELIAVMDLITGYPQASEAFIGWFMVDAELQRRGIGSQIFADVRAAMKAQGYGRLEVACPEASEPGLAFWKAQGFELTGSRDDGGDYPVVYLARTI